MPYKTNYLSLNIIQSFFFLCLLLVASSCQLSENYWTTPIVCKGQKHEHTYSHEKYNASHIIKILEESKPKDFRYYFMTFLAEGNTEYMLIQFRNEEYCIDVKLRVQNWEKLKGMKKVNGKSYPKELYDLQWTIGSAGSINYVDMNPIID